MFSSGTLGFCFIFRFLFGYDGTFTHVFWPMRGSHRLTPLPYAGDSLDALLFDLLARAKSPLFHVANPG
jgi:hypothetical protein